MTTSIMGQTKMMEIPWSGKGMPEEKDCINPENPGWQDEDGQGISANCFIMQKNQGHQMKLFQ